MSRRSSLLLPSLRRSSVAPIALSCTFASKPEVFGADARRSRQRRFARATSAACALAALSLAASCSSSNDGFEDPPQQQFPPADCTIACATDGRAIVDCHGNVVTACDSDSSCLDNRCVPGCEAALKTQSTVGCEYFAAKPSARGTFFPDYDFSCYAVMVANTWNSPVTLSVEYDGQSISSSYFRIPRGRGKDIRYDLLPEGKLPAGELAILFLAQQPPQPNDFNDTYAPCPEGVGAAIVGQTEVRGSGYGKTFHVRASAPVVAYDIYPYGGAESYIPSSSLLLPTSAWATDNLAMDGYSADSDTAKQGALPYFQILAQEDDTHVTLVPTATLSSAGGAPQVGKGQTTQLTLRRGEFVQFTQVEEVNGTPVAADKPVSLVGGTTCITIPNTSPACDTVHQQLPPIRLLGDGYVATRYRDRQGPAEPETTPWRILAAADGTTLTYDPPVPGAPTTLDRGKWAEFWAPGPFVVRSQDPTHPIYVASYMTAGGPISTNDGDPEFVNVVPIGQYLSSYVFLTDPTYGNTNLVFVREPVEGKYEDIELDCLGTVGNWQSVGGSGYQVAYVDLVRAGFPQGNCDNGVHRASSKAAFGLTVWGWDRYASYGFPAGMGTKPLNDVGAIPVR